jgi:hypothetical protein
MKELISSRVKQLPINARDEPQLPGSKTGFPNTIILPMTLKWIKESTQSYHQLPRNLF